MQKIIRNCLILCMLVSFHGLPVRRDITIKLKVHGSDDQLTGKILHDLKTNLGNKPNIVIVNDTTDSSTFTITVQYATLKSGDKLTGFFMNSLLTQRIRTSTDESADMLVRSSVSSTSKESDIDRMCKDLIDQFDQEYFEKENRKEK